LNLQTGLERLRGYEDALREADIQIDRRLILEGDFRYESGYRLGKDLLLRRVRPTAIFVCNGVMTLGVLKAFEEMGVRCPDDMALATFDDLAVDRSFHPHLTAVVQPGYEIGARAATILMDRIEGKLTNEPFVVRIVPTLVVRESTQSRKQRRASSIELAPFANFD
jgi:LacI family transcriptional regulator